MYRQCSCLYRYSAHIFNIGTYSDPYTSIGATLVSTVAKNGMGFNLVCQLSQKMLWPHACILLRHNVHQVLEGIN